MMSLRTTPVIMMTKTICYSRVASCYVGMSQWSVLCRGVESEVSFEGGPSLPSYLTHVIPQLLPD